MKKVYNGEYQSNCDDKRCIVFNVKTSKRDIESTVQGLDSCADLKDPNPKRPC